MSSEIDILWSRLREHAGPYPPQAFIFVQEGLRHTCDRLYTIDEDGPTDGSRHVTGQELCLGLRDYAQQQFGLLAMTVLNSWNIRRTEDFGKIVFAMIEAGLLRKTEQDSIADFQNVYDFPEVFGSTHELC
ncbi:MAG: Minf_1886 family protein [Phycisphaerales bacterium]|nr:hypothetical protein [bacterium]